MSENSTQNNVKQIAVSWQENDDTTPVYAVIEAMAEATNSDPLELPPLSKVIDPEALNTLFTESNTNNQVQFHYSGFEVRVTNNKVQIEPIQEE